MPSSNRRTTPNYTGQAVDDLIGNPPGWLLRSGINIVAIVMITIITMSAFIRYPDKIVAPGVMSGEYPPIEHLNKLPGIIDTIYVEEGQWVEKGMPIAYIKNAVDKKDLQKIERLIAQCQKARQMSDYLNIRIPNNLQIGDLTTDYAHLQLLLKEFQSMIRQSGTYEQVRTLEIEIEKTKQLAGTLQKEKQYTAEEVELIETDLERNNYLLEEGIISKVEKEKTEGQLLRQNKQYNNLDINIIQNSIKEEQLKLEIQKISEDRKSELNGYRFKIQELINRIQHQAREWKENHFILAEISGRIVLHTDVTENMFVQANTSVISIIPTQKSDGKYARIITPVQGIGKIETGDKTILKLDGYPYKEYGIIISNVSSIAPLPSIDRDGNKNYEIKILLGDTLITNYEKTLQYKPQSTLIAEIITKDKSVLERITEQFLNLIIDK